MSKKSDKRKRVDPNEYNKLCLSYKEKYKEKEVWKQIVYKGYTTNCAISNYGRIFNIDKIRIPNITKCNLHFATNIKIDGTKKTKCIGIYRLVALMFIPIPEKYIKMGYTIDELVVDHKRDGDKDNFQDNTIWNLQWLTHRENISKASSCGHRKPFERGFRDRLDGLILNGMDNKYIYMTLYEEYGYTKDEMKSMIQVRRRRLGKTLKDHYENDKKYVKKIDNMILNGMSNKEIAEKLNMDTSTRPAMRLLQYRRSILKKPANVSRYLNNADNEKMKELIASGMKNKEIIKYFHLENLDENEKTKLNKTISTRRYQYKKKYNEITSSRPFLSFAVT